MNRSKLVFPATGFAYSLFMNWDDSYDQYCATEPTLRRTEGVPMIIITIVLDACAKNAHRS